jgi:hypothetical protein
MIDDARNHEREVMNICSHFQTVLRLQMKYSSLHHSPLNLSMSWSVVSVFTHVTKVTLGARAKWVTLCEHFSCFILL